MQITWYGHACFEVGNGVRIVTDPYTPEVARLRPVPRAADIVIMSSSDDEYHSCGAAVPGDPLILDALEIARDGGRRETHGLRFDAIEVRESIVHKPSPESNAMYAFELDGIRVAHMGDVGNPLTAAQLEFLRGADVLLALTGGPPTIELDDLDLVLREVQPRLVIPMHYRIPELPLNILELEAFSRRYPAEIVELRPETTVELTPERLPDHMRIVALQPVANGASYPHAGPAWTL